MNIINNDIRVIEIGTNADWNQSQHDGPYRMVPPSDVTVGLVSPHEYYSYICHKP